MAEWRFFDEGETPFPSTAAFHRHRERAPHLEQPVHRGRLEAAADLVWFAAGILAADGRAEVAASDLGCGDGGGLSLLTPGAHATVPLRAWGYDFQPSNAAGWAERGVDAELLDVVADRDRVRLGDVAITTEFLEHLADPHETVRWLGAHCPFLVASSPWGEHAGGHDPVHTWAWDWDGYEALLHVGGYVVVAHRAVGPFQVVLGAQESTFEKVLAATARGHAATLGPAAAGPAVR